MGYACVWIKKTPHSDIISGINCMYTIFRHTEKRSSLGEEMKNKYHEEAASLKAETKIECLSPEMRELKMKKHLKQLKFEVW